MNPTQKPADDTPPVEKFIARWASAAPSERGNAQLFLSELCDLLVIDRPQPDISTGYAFEFPVTQHHADGSSSEGRIDLYKRGCFVLEAKQFQSAYPEPSELMLALKEAYGGASRKKTARLVRGSDAWDDAMVKARGQAERYVRALPGSEANPPFVLVVDVGHSIEVFADFTQAGKAYLPFPDPRTFRLRLDQLRDPKVQERLRSVWTDPKSLDPARYSADVTREVSAHLAALARSLEAEGHSPRLVADFLCQCLFCMFAEDVGLLPKDGFSGLLNSLQDDPTQFQPLVSQLFHEMAAGTGSSISLVLRKKLLRFNGGLFEDGNVLPVNRDQLDLLRAAAKLNWRSVEPAIFGTLLERALNPDERHKLGAHFTPRAYVERLVLPTVVEPIRAEWEHVRAAAITHARTGSLTDARDEILEFHRRLCEVRVLDPACGCGNFLYVTLEHLKRLEGEVLDVAAGFGESFMLELSDRSVDPHQFLGIEINPRAVAVTELVLWIGYLQWHFRTRGQTLPAEPVLKKFKNIECRDAVLLHDGVEKLTLDAAGNQISAWDRRSTKLDPVTGKEVPDESKQVPLFSYSNPQPAKWPETDYIVGNPPFLGGWLVRQTMGDGYVEALWKAYDEIPEKADYVMYWWHKAAELARAGRIRRFGFITTNSLRQVFQRRVVQTHLTPPSTDQRAPLSLLYAIPDHPWVDTTDGAAVRIAMTVGILGQQDGELLEVTSENQHEEYGAEITFSSRRGRIQADITLGAPVSSTLPLCANDGVCSPGVQLYGDGFIVSQEEAKQLLDQAPSTEARKVIRAYVNGRDLMGVSRNVCVIDFAGLDEDSARRLHPNAFQRVLTHVKPERDQNRRESIRRLWWRFGWERPALRRALASLPRYIATVETSKHRTFQFLNAAILPDNMLIAVALDDAFFLGVLSSRIHVAYALAAGGTLEDRPRYNKSRCFDPFPFPVSPTEQKARIRDLAEEIDAHRKRAQAAHPSLTLTGIYNVLESLREGRPLTAKEKQIHEQGLVSVLRQLHDELNQAVATAYGWPWPMTDDQILERVVALNAERAKEEASGQIRWLRPEYQNPGGKGVQQSQLAVSVKPNAKPGGTRKSASKQPWPKTLAERVKAVDQLLRASDGPVTAEEIAKSLSRATMTDVVDIMESLVAIGRAHKLSDQKRYAP